MTTMGRASRLRRSAFAISRSASHPREANASLARGAQGNALKTIVAMAFALDGAKASM
jgi:hypothetical protein